MKWLAIGFSPLLSYLVRLSSRLWDAVPCRSARCPRHTPFFQSGPQARQKNYEWILEGHPAMFFQNIMRTSALYSVDIRAFTHDLLIELCQDRPKLLRLVTWYSINTIEYI